MADYQAVFAVGDALVKYLTNSYDPAVVGFPCTFKLVSSAEIAKEDTTALDKTLYLDLHYLICYWDASAEGAEAEQKILVWTMQQLQSHPLLDTSILSLSSSAPGWTNADSVQIIPADLSLQDILDIWDGLGPKYRLTVGYVARAVRVDRIFTPELPVVATRF